MGGGLGPHLTFKVKNMASKTSICNMAISHLGIGKEIAILDTDKSDEAEACRRFYNIVRDGVLRSSAWPFARRRAQLQLVSQNTASTDEWCFTYKCPADCLKVLKIQSGLTFDTRQSRVPYVMESIDSGSVIMTNMPDAIIHYIKREEQVDRYPADFSLAFSLLLAYYIAPRVAGGDPFKRGDAAKARYDEQITVAQANSFNEQQMPEDPEGELTRARNGFNSYDDSWRWGR